MVRNHLRGFSARGMTLVEVLIGTALLVGAGSAMLMGMQQSVVHTDYLRQFQVAMNAAQGTLEALEATAFETLWAQAQANPTGRREALAGVPGGTLAIQIRSADTLTPTNPAFLDLHVAACWQARGRQIGEADCQDGADAETWVDSPAMVSTRVALSD